MLKGALSSNGLYDLTLTEARRKETKADGNKVDLEVQGDIRASSKTTNRGRSIRWAQGSQYTGATISKALEGEMGSRRQGFSG